MIGTLLKERYKIESELGRGGMGEVYCATDLHNGETIAIKALNADVLTREPDLLARFIREGEALHMLNHPNIVRMIAAFEDNDKHYLAMEYVEGGSLQSLLDVQKKLSASEALKIALEVSDALSRAHHLGIIHRDLKPANILIAKDGTPRLADFGIAHMDSNQNLTQSGVLIGTVDYLSPEVCQGKRPDERSDIWSFGVMLFEMLSGRLPFEGNTLTAQIAAILTQPVPDLTQIAPEMPVSFVKLINRMLDKDPEWRIPSVRLVGAELEAILKGHETVTPTYIAATPKVRRTLPSNLSKFIGREKEIAEVKEALNEYRLVTLTGSGGVGKTRLSLQVATELLEQFPNGTWFVELAPITDPDLVPQTILTAADMQLQQGKSALDSLLDFLREKNSLIVLDNCEHLIEACAKLVDTVLNTAPNLRILASSREALGVKGEMAWHVPSLSIPDLKHLPAVEGLSQYEAVRLFVDRAMLVQPHFVVANDNANAVAQICARLDGIPLAIELAAARVKVLKPEQIAEKLNDRFRLLTGGARTALPRQQTLRALIDWSYDLLAENEKLLLRRLAVFMGGWTLEAAEQVCNDEQLHDNEVMDILIRLVDKSLVVVDVQPSQQRYRMLETVRQYAREKLMASGEGERLHTQHLIYFLKFAEEAEPHLFRAEQIEWMNRLELDHDNLRSAFEWALNDPQSIAKEAALRLCNTLWYFWYVRGYFIDGCESLEKALLKPNQSKVTVARGRALGYFANWVWIYKRYNKAVLELYIAESLEIALTLGDRQGMAFVFYVKAWFALDANNVASAKIAFNESLRIYQEINDLWGMARAKYQLGEIERAVERDFLSAHQHFEKSMQLFQQIGERLGLEAVIGGLGDLAKDRGDWAEALSLHKQSLSLARELGDKYGIYLWKVGMGVDLLAQGIYHYSGKPLEDLFAESLSIAREVGSKNDIALTLFHMGRVVQYQADYEKARILYTESLILSRELEVNDGTICWCLLGQGDLAQLENDIAMAHSCYSEALSLAKEAVLSQQVMPYLLEGFAALHEAQGQAKRSAILFGAAETLRQVFHFAVLPVEKTAHAKKVDATRAQLSSEEFDQAWAEGKSMTMEEAIALAMEETT